MKGKNLATFFGIIIAIALAAVLALQGATIGNFEVDSVADSIKLGLDIEGGVAVVYEAQTDQTGDELTQTMNQTVQILSKRINSLGLTEPDITVQGVDRIRIELPGVDNAQKAIEAIGQTAQLEFILVDEEYLGKVFTGMPVDAFEGEVVTSGKEIKDAKYGNDRYGKPAVDLVFDSEGVVNFRDATQRAKDMDPVSGGQIAIVLDKTVISAPRANVVIVDGKAQITGNFTVDEAGTLANLIRGGALPVELKEIETKVISATLGLGALKSSIDAAKVGLILVLAFMIIYYRLPGFIASIALILYSCILLFTMVGLNATLTLPGIAGIVLSLGMAVDANVIIFERIKEELRNGKSLRASVESGFKRAFRTILDSNITTFIAAIVLYYFGSGSIQGFAITLMIGIVTSMLTAVVITKTLLKSSLGMGFLNNKKLFGA